MLFSRNLSFALAAASGMILAGCADIESLSETGAVPPLAKSLAPLTSSGSAKSVVSASAAQATKAEMSQAEAYRFLTRATFGADMAGLEAMQADTATAFLEREFAKPGSYVLDDFLAAPRNKKGKVNLNRLSGLYWDQMISGEDQLRQRMSFALSQILVYADSGNGPTALHRAYFQDVLTRNAFGNYRDLLQEVTYSPAMGRWLTYLRNRKGNAKTGRMPDENYAREVLQLFSIGLFEMNMDGTAKRDGTGNEIPTFDNEDIIGLARVFTGLTYDTGQNRFGGFVEAAAHRPMIMFEKQHSPLEKRFLGTTIPAGTPGDETISRALDTIFDHPNVAPFVSRQLIQRFTTSSPTPDYIRRVATAFETGSFVAPDGTQFGSTGRGDLQATLAAILLDPSLDAATYETDSVIVDGKIREPILRFVHWARAFNLQNVDAFNERKLGNTSDPATGLGQHPYRSPSVFNFYRPGYVAPGTESGALDLTAPELQIVNESTATGYLNFMTQMVADKGGQRDRSTPSFAPDYTAELALVDTPDRLVAHLNTLLTGDRMTQEEQDAIVDILETLPIHAKKEDKAAKDRLQKVHTAVALVVNSPAFAVTW